MSERSGNANEGLFGDMREGFNETEPSASSPLREYSPSELLDEILLSSVPGVGALITEYLLARFGSASEVFRASVSELCSVDKVGETTARKILNAREECDPEAIARFCEDNEIDVLTLRDVRYPSRLREIDNPPQLLYVRGKILPRDRLAIAIVGTREISSYGVEQTTRFGRELAEMGFTIVSGLALGADGCAHRSALNAKGRALAVLGGGVAKIYPREHEDLAARVISSGALISEYHPLMAPLSGNFPARNRIVSGLSIGALVIESRSRGGSMITARFAAEQNREVFAVPGRVDSPNSQGCHDLIREGATLVASVEDIVNALPHYERAAIPVENLARLNRKMSPVAPGTVGVSQTSIDSISRKPARTPRRSSSGSRANPEQRRVEAPSRLFEAAFDEPKPAPTLNLNEDERKLVDAIGAEAIPVDVAIRRSGLSTSRALALVSCLEMKRVLRRLEGNMVARGE